jgi:hypothetical protein
MLFLAVLSSALDCTLAGTAFHFLFALLVERCRTFSDCPNSWHFSSCGLILTNIVKYLMRAQLDVHVQKECSERILLLETVATFGSPVGHV